ncbi:MAG: response regulator [Phycisphaerales bacterium]|nr:response regulator [Phycisphaerales bacterium]
MKTTLRSDKLNCIVIDDNPDHTELICHAIENALREDAIDYEIMTFDSPIEGLAELPAGSDAVILIDYQLSGSTGTEWVSDFVGARVGPVIMLTSSGNQRIAAEAFREGVSDYLLKDEVIRKPEKLREAMRESLRRFALEQKNRELSMQLKLSNSELNQRNERLRELTESAHRFVDDVAHEFRTPLTVIKEFASIIDDGLGGEVTAKQQEYLRFIIDATRDLSGLIDDFLNSSKLRSNMLKVSRRATPVTSIIDTIWPMILTRAGAREIEVVREIADGLPMVYADADKAQRTLLNLVVNAVKYSDTGQRIVIRADRHDDDCVRVSVRDEGPGLPEEACRKLFERFSRCCDEMRQESISGFGLGLSIVRELSGINLGEVFVESELGAGSTFSFTLPVDQSRSVIKRFVSHLSQRSARTVVAAMRIECDACLREGFKPVAVLESACRSNDLLLDSLRDDRILMIGADRDAISMRDRVREQLIRREDCRRMLESGQLRLVPVGQWPVAQLLTNLDLSDFEGNRTEEDHAEFSTNYR